MLCFIKSLPWLGIEMYVSNIAVYFYLFKFCAKMSRVTWALNFLIIFHFFFLFRLDISGSNELPLLNLRYNLFMGGVPEETRYWNFKMEQLNEI